MYGNKNSMEVIAVKIIFGGIFLQNKRWENNSVSRFFMKNVA